MSLPKYNFIPFEMAIVTSKDECQSFAAYQHYVSDQWEFRLGSRISILNFKIKPSVFSSDYIKFLLKGSYDVKSDADCWAIFDAIKAGTTEFWLDVIKKVRKDAFAEGAHELRVEFRKLMQLEPGSRY